jgi:cytochrome d ubiquinol oxidase subunit II
METLWFVLVALMLIAYVVLDGFDLGAGAVSLFLARTSEERQQILSAIGPVWDGNEVWLIAAGGALFFAFPVLYASAFSGFYLPLMIVLWLLMLRGVGIELRSHLHDPLWQAACEFTFFLSSALLAIFFGAAIGNVVRGVPLRADGYFFQPLWTDFRVGVEPGILDWYTVLTGVLALVALAVHGSLYLVVKTVGVVHSRARRMAQILWPVVVLLTVFSLVATVYVRPEIEHNFRIHVWGWLIPVMVVGSLFSIRLFLGRGTDLAAFFSSAVYLAAMLGGAAFGTYPALLPSISNRAYDLTIYNAGTGAYSMQVGLIWWMVGMVLATAYFIFLYTSFRGKVNEGG